MRGPQVNDEYGDVDTVMYAVTGDGADYHMLDKVVEDASSAPARRRRTSMKVDVYGEQMTPHLRRVQRDEDRQPRRWEPQAVFDSLAKQNAITDAGVFETTSNRVRIQVTERAQGRRRHRGDPDPEANGKVFRLGDIANVYAGFEDPPTFLARYRGQPAIVVGVVMAKRRQCAELRQERRRGR